MEGGNSAYTGDSHEEAEDERKMIKMLLKKKEVSNLRKSCLDLRKSCQKTSRRARIEKNWS